MIPSISWKNIWRNKTRSLIVITAVTIGLFGGLFGSAMMIGMSERRVDEALNKEISHIQIHNPKYLENPEVGLVIDNAGDVLDFIQRQDGVKAVASRIKLTSMINSSNSNSGITLLGIDPQREKNLTEIYRAVYDSAQVVDKYEMTDPDKVSEFLEDSVGQYIDNSGRNPILVGEELAKKLNIKVRSKVVLTFQGVDGGLHGGAFRVCGIYRTENSAFEEMNAFVLGSDLSRLIDGGEDLCHEIAIMMDDMDEVPAMVRLLSEKYPGLTVQGWKEIQPDVAMLNDLMTVSTAIIMVIILLALGFGIVNTMLMVVLERTKEIGMLIAVGMSRIKVFLMIILESVLLSLTGAFIGMGIAVTVISILGKHGLDLTSVVQEGFEAIGYGAVFYPTMGFELYVMVTLMVVAAAVVASVYPAIKALKLNPAVALRTE
jgi:ABC-type lipoprotein release transport system permease subunit